eukprot:5535206-Pyramimonas_sp.AAC.1
MALRGRLGRELLSGGAAGRLAEATAAAALRGLRPRDAAAPIELAPPPLPVASGWADGRAP